VYPPLSDYALIGDCHAAALVSRGGSIDWCCLPRFDSESCFGRLLDWERGGFFAITPHGRYQVRREYLGESLILVTTFECDEGAARLIDFVSMRRGGRTRPRRELIRLVEGVHGRVSFDITFMPRFDFGEVKPWIEAIDHEGHFAIGGSTALLIYGNVALKLSDAHALEANLTVAAGERRHLALQSVLPEEVIATPPSRAGCAKVLDQHFAETIEWWRDWVGKVTLPEPARARVIRSAIVLKALSYAPTGAIIAAPTTSLPEQIGGERNWDYRYSWLRDSVFTVHALADLGFVEEADGFRRFIQRTAAGNADELQVLYGVDGRRRLTEITLPHLEGWRGSRPVRIGNAATDQYQGDMYGLLLELSWRWTERGNSIGPDYWEFLVKIVETAIERWPLPDRGIWEIRSAPRHFVTSKVMCWTAVDRGIALAEAHSLPAPFAHWRRVRDEIRAAIEEHGVDARRGNFVQCFGSTEVDAALLLLPEVKFVDYADERMQRTVEAIRTDLEYQGLVLRYRTQDGLRGDEGVFLPCSFWLAECLAKQGRRAEADAVFERACGCANDLGLYSEEYAVGQGGNGTMLGNFPQGLSHLAHISAAMALADLQAHAPTRVAPKTQGPGPAPSRR
jgi:GH15 family glucan-1,4-alpha-glucosidase